MRFVPVVLLILVFVLSEARRQEPWETNFDVPSGYKSYLTQRDTGKRQNLDDMSMGFEGFLDEGLEGDVRTPTHVNTPTSVPLFHSENKPAIIPNSQHHHLRGGHHEHHHEHHHDQDLEKQEHHSHHHHQESGGHHHHAHHSHHTHEHHVAFIQLEESNSPVPDAALEEAQHDYVNHQQEQMMSSQPPESTQSSSTSAETATAILKSSQQHSHETQDREFDQISLKSNQSPKPVRINTNPDAAISKEVLPMSDLMTGAQPIQSLSQLQQTIKTLEQIILNRDSGDESITSIISDAAKTGESVQFFPRMSLRTGLQPGILPGLVDTASTSAAMLAPLLSKGLDQNIKLVSELQEYPDAVTQLQKQLPQVMPDSPQLHPLQNLRQQSIKPNMLQTNANNVDMMNLVNTPSSSLLETSRHTSLDHTQSLREDQAADLQFFRGLGQGLEVIGSIFGNGGENQKQLLEAASMLKSMGSDQDATMGAIALLETESQTNEPGNRVPTQSMTGVESGLLPSTFAAAPGVPVNPAHPYRPDSELDWMLDSLEAKGYTGTPQQLDFNRFLSSVKGFLKKGQQVMDTIGVQKPKTDPQKIETNTDGFENWPQPFWWTRPPAWLDDIPGWMQRLEMKKSSSSHRAAVYG